MAEWRDFAGALSGDPSTRWDLLPADALAPETQPARDPFEIAGARLRRSVEPEGGRQEGRLTHAERIPPALLWSLLSMPQRVGDANTRYMQTGEFDPAPFVDAALLTMGATPFGAPRGALGAGPVRRGGLPMDEASRMARLKEGGFYVNMPLYHGTSSAFRAFDLSRGGHTTGAAPAREGVWSALSPEIAEEFAHLAVQERGGNAQIYPLLHRTERPVSLTPQGDEKNHEIAATLAQAWDDGYTSVLLENYTSPGGKKGDILVVRDPNQLRSPYAAFDPAKRDSADLLASFAGWAPLSGGAGSDAFQDSLK